MINTKIHGYIDYMMGLLLIISPMLLDLPKGAASTLPVVLGIGTIIYSLLTDYELGLFKVVPLKLHLGIDLFAGLLLITAPWLFDFDDEVIWPFVILGILEVGISLLTERHTTAETANTRA